MGEIVIRYSGRLLERVIYVTIILVLATLLVIAYVGKDDCSPNTVSEEVVEETDTAPAATDDAEAPATSEPEEPEEPEETCQDSIKNQDETDIDCGGNSCNACAEGKKCKISTDCKDAACDGGVCGVKLELSGERSIKITGVEYEENADTSAAKVTEVRLQVENGADKILNARVEIWVKTADGLFYLGQPEDNTENGKNPYGEYSLPPIPVGETKTYTLDREGDVFSSGYLFSIPFGAYYGGGDDFMVEVKLIGKSGEGIIDTATYTVNV